MKRRAAGYTWLEITKAYYNIIFKNKTMNEFDFYTIECIVNSKQYSAGKFHITSRGQLLILDTSRFTMSCDKGSLAIAINGLDISQLDEIKIKYKDYDKIN